MSVKFNYKLAENFISEEEIKNLAPMVTEAHKMLHEKTGAGNDFLGWVELPKNYDQELKRLLKKSGAIPRFLSLSVLVVHTLVQELPLNF